MLDEKKYKQLKDEFGEYSSWAIWAREEPNSPASNVGDISIFDNPKIIDELHTEYIFFGLNPAEHKDLNNDSWCAFHSNDTKRQRDYKIRYALRDTPYWGSYITDVIKEIRNTNSHETVIEFKKDKRLQEKAIKDLERELEIIGGTPTPIAFGNYVYELLSRINADLKLFNKDIIKVPHYSAWCSKEKYRQRLSERLSGIIIYK